MALQGSGTIKLSEIQTEFTGSNPISLSEYYRNGIYVPSNNTNVPTSGAISLGQFYGAVRQFTFTISSNFTTPQNLATLAVAAGWDGSSPLVAINDAIISSNTTATPALTISASFPAGVTLINNGTIVGMGGAGAVADDSFFSAFYYGTNGYPGGHALSTATALTIENNGTIAGGGGGGGAGNTFSNAEVYNAATSGGGGGRSGLTNSAGGGSAFIPVEGWVPSYGTNGTFSAPGVGTDDDPYYNHYAGVGGDWGQPGQNGTSHSETWKASFGSVGPRPGGAGGNAVVGNSYVTWAATGARYGALV
jgi:hypothetical protein